MFATIDRRLTPLALGLGLVIAAAAPAAAAPGDIHRVAHAETVNLRAGPSNESNVRGTVQQGDEVIELARSEAWYGVRVLRTGEEGWIFGELLEPVASSTLGAAGAPAPAADVGFLRWSEGFNRLISGINADLGYPMVRSVEQPKPDLLQVTPTTQWLINGSREAHLMSALAIYEMWKNHQNGAPVRIVILDDQGREYIRVVDQDNVPILSTAIPERS